jgi:hypothetical protein
MKLSKIAAFGAVALTLATLAAPAMVSANGVDPTSGRINDRVTANREEYFRCASFSLRVYKAGLSQAGNNSAKIRAARSHYQANLQRYRNATS